METLYTIQRHPDFVMLAVSQTLATFGSCP